MKISLLILIVCFPLVSQQIPIDNRAVQGKVPPGMMPKMEQQPVDPDLLNTIEQYEKLIEQYPGNSDLRYNLGNLKYLAGDHEGAIDEYRQNLSTLDEQKKSHALYNIGNSLFSQGKYQESADFYKKALQVNPDDEDMKVNYELTRRMLQQQQQQQSQQSDNDKKEEDEEKKQEQQEKHQSENQDGEKKDSGEEQEAEENQQEPEKKPGDEESQEEEQQRLKEKSEEKQLAKEEAEAILNALKASQKNLMKKKYVAKNRTKLEKDW